MGSLCQVPKIMYTISYAFNITLLIVIIVKVYLSGFISTYICLLSKMLQNLGSCVLLEGFTNFLVDPNYDPLSLVMIQYTIKSKQTTQNDKNYEVKKGVGIDSTIKSTETRILLSWFSLQKFNPYFLAHYIITVLSLQLHVCSPSCLDKS